ncbi:hypothetical protein TrispH2_009391 [Trichoplax sp. H2]|nr:hypothetical protein TrispH2_009391 [Trichoplax sp. H2]|eukprot:RDD39770.1 hypothetical protein TrispH2_009391 [Trichoplax sp. H2]
MPIVLRATSILLAVRIGCLLTLWLSSATLIADKSNAFSFLISIDDTNDTIVSH